MWRIACIGLVWGAIACASLGALSTGCRDCNPAQPDSGKYTFTCFDGECPPGTVCDVRSICVEADAGPAPDAGDAGDAGGSSDSGTVGDAGDAAAVTAADGATR